MTQPMPPALYQINTRVWLTELSGGLGRPATLPDLREEDIAGSGFAITGYTVPESMGGDAALAQLRARLRKRGLRLMLDYQNKLARFLENHDEPLRQFYERLLAVLRRPELRNGEWRLLDCVPAWEGNWTVDCFLAFAWQGGEGDPLLVAVNDAPHQSQCYLRLPYPNLAGQSVRLKDVMGPADYVRDGNELTARGLYLDLPPWGYHVFALSSPASLANRDSGADTKSDSAPRRQKINRATKTLRPKEKLK